MHSGQTTIIFEDNYDPNKLPRYVQDNPEYLQMFQEFNYYPKLNKQGEPVCYLFKNEKSGYTLVGDHDSTLAYLLR